jgi:hypothetical protein
MMPIISPSASVLNNTQRGRQARHQLPSRHPDMVSVSFEGGVTFRIGVAKEYYCFPAMQQSGRIIATAYE